MSGTPCTEFPTAGQMETACELWGLENCTFLRKVENFIYRTKQGSEDRILRITDPIHRSIEQLQSELHWMAHLVRGVNEIAAPIPSLSGNLIETLSVDGKILFASVFERARGAFLNERQDFTPEVFVNWGKILGKLHSATMTYSRPKEIAKRPEWSEDSVLRNVKRGLDPKDTFPFECFKGAIAWLESLEQTPTSYNLIHADLHHGNFYVYESRLTLFDFDDCHYQWLSYDFGVTLFSLLFHWADKSIPISMNDFMASFLEGYSSEHSLGQIWLDRIPGFLRYRTALLYHWSKVQIVNQSLDAHGTAWCKRCMNWCSDQLRKPAVYL